MRGVSLRPPPREGNMEEPPHFSRIAIFFLLGNQVKERQAFVGKQQRVQQLHDLNILRSINSDGAEK